LVEQAIVAPSAAEDRAARILMPRSRIAPVLVGVVLVEAVARTTVHHVVEPTSAANISTSTPKQPAIGLFMPRASPSRRQEPASASSSESPDREPP